MNKTNVVNEKEAELSFMENLMEALKNDDGKVSAQCLCSVPKIVPTTSDKGHSKELATARK